MTDLLEWGFPLVTESIYNYTIYEAAIPHSAGIN